MTVWQEILAAGKRDGMRNRDLMILAAKMHVPPREIAMELKTSLNNVKATLSQARRYDKSIPLFVPGRKVSGRPLVR